MDITSTYISFALDKIGSYFRYLAIDLADPRTLKWPLMGDPTIVLVMLWVYATFVIKVGPAIMKDRTPFDLKKILIVYNFLQVLISAYIAYDALTSAFLSGEYSLRCQPVDWRRSKSGINTARGCYLYFLAKCTELLETVFFVLRKKFNQISFLHFIHHTGMVLLSYGVTKYYPGGNIVFYGMINSMVHTVMYTYYMISAMGPEYQKYLWWKKYITVIQLIQFFIGVTHASQLLFIDCGFPKWILWIVIPNGTAFYFLFYDFYQKAYKKQQENKAFLKKSKAQDNNNNQESNGTLNNAAKLRGAATSLVDVELGGYYTFATFMLCLYLTSYPHNTLS